MTAMNPGSKQHLNNLCNVFEMPTTATRKDPHAALGVLTSLYAMPVIKEQGKRRLHGIEVLKSAHEHFPPKEDEFTSRLHGEVTKHVGRIQAIPDFYKNLNMKEDDLISRYESFEKTAFLLGYIGIGSVASAGVGGATEFVKTGSVRASIETAVRRALGQGSFTQAVQQRLGLVGKGGWIGSALIATGWIAYLNATKEMEEIRKVVQHRYQKNEISKKSYAKVFDQVDPSNISKYW